MQLMVRDVSAFFRVSESTVMRWIKRRGLPSRRVDGRFHFNRAELLEWATANRIETSVTMFDDLEAVDEPIPSLIDALEAGGVFHRLPGTEKNHVLHALIQALPLPDDIEREEIFRLFLARESLASTAIGDGIALPHVRNPIVLHVARPMVALCFLEHPIDFGALDGQPVRVLFSLICPTTRSHLQLLARLSYALRDARFKEVVMGQGQREEIMREARRIEASLVAQAHGEGKVSQ